MARIRGGTIFLSNVAIREELGSISQDLQFYFNRQGKIKKEYFNFTTNVGTFKFEGQTTNQVYSNELLQSWSKNITDMTPCKT
jgi:hypothetical protein